MVCLQSAGLWFRKQPLQQGFLRAQGSTSTEVTQTLDAVLVGGLQQSISASFVKLVQDWGVQQGLTERQLC